MKESIVCIGRMAREPYRFPETGVCVFSYEEICYYLSRHMICYLRTLPEEELLYFIKEDLGLDGLYRQLARLSDPEKDQMKYFSALFREGNYFTEEEIRRILDGYRSLKNAPYSLQCKWLGDLYLNSDQAAMAVSYYKEALKRENLEAKEAGAACHNLGIAKARLFRFSDAKIAFLKAYQHCGEKESLFYYYCLVAFEEGTGRAEEEIRSMDLSDLAVEAFEDRYGKFLEAYARSGDMGRYNRMVFLEQNERQEEARNQKDRFVRAQQRAFRSQLVRRETIPAANLPDAPR